MKYAYVGLVDILTKYSCKKKFENLLLNPFLPGISCQPPILYGDRLDSFVELISQSKDDDCESIESKKIGRIGWLQRAQKPHFISMEIGRKDFRIIPTTKDY